MVCLATFHLMRLRTKNPRAPSYFTQFFEDQVRQNEESGGVRTLYIDRDPATFRDIARHLQGNQTPRRRRNADRLRRLPCQAD